MAKKNKLHDGYPARYERGVPIWNCQYCGKKYQTKRLTEQHERRYHE